MLINHNRKPSNFLLQCCKSDQSIPFVQLQRDKRKTNKISLKQTKSTRKITNLIINPENTIEKPFLFEPFSPKISFNYLSPENKDHHRSNIKEQKDVLSIVKSQKSIKTQPSNVSIQNQVKSTIAIPPKLMHLTLNQKQNIQMTGQKIEKCQNQDRQSFKTQKVKTNRNQFEENSTIVLNRQEMQHQIQKESQIEFENSIVIKESSQVSRNNSQQKNSKDFHNSQKIEAAVKKWRRANTFTMSHQVFERKERQLNVSSNTVKIIKQDYKKGSLFQKVRRIDTKLYQADQQSSSSDRSEVIDDYKSLMSKIQTKEMQDSAFIQI